jgi:ankyrin repeat protein
MHSASREGNLELLRSYPDDLNLQDEENGYTPLMYASAQNHHLCVEYLLENWASLTIRSEVRQFPWIY